MATTPLATDNFNRANGAVGASWTTVSSQGGLVVASNQLEASSYGTDSAAFYNGVTWPNDQYSQIQAITSTQTFGNIGVLCRASSSANTFYNCIWNGALGASNALEIWKNTTGTWVKIGTFTMTVNTTDTIQMQCVGTINTAYVNSVSKLIATSDSAITSGNAGVFMNSPNAITNAIADNWEGGSVGAAAGKLFRRANLDGIGAGGPFFANPLGV